MQQAIVLNDNYDRAIAILDELESDASVRSLARQFGIARLTVRNVRDNAEWYRQQGRIEIETDRRERAAPTERTQ